MAAAAISYFQKFEILTGVRGQLRLYRSAFIRIDQTVVEIGDLTVSQNGGRPPSLIR